MINVAVQKEYTYLLEDTSSEEGDDRNNGNDTHVPKDGIDFGCNASKSNRSQANKRHPVLFESETFLGGSNRPHFQFAFGVE